MWNELVEYLRYHSCLSDLCNLFLSQYFLLKYFNISFLFKMFYILFVHFYLEFFKIYKMFPSNSLPTCVSFEKNSSKNWFLVRRISQAGVLLFLSRYFLCNSWNLPRSIRFQIILKYFCRHKIYIFLGKSYISIFLYQYFPCKKYFLF